MTPLITSNEYVVPAVAAGADKETVLGLAPFDGVLTVAYLPKAAITGAATNNRVLSLVNKGQAGTGTVVVASLALDAGITAAAYTGRVIPVLSGYDASGTVYGALNGCVRGDTLRWRSIHVGTGIADPGGTVRLTFQRG
jgi:hypothetical protein